MTSEPDLRAMQRDPGHFRRALLIDVNGVSRPLASVVDAWQEDDFLALDRGWMRAAGHQVDCGKQRAYLERPRGHSKTSDLAAMVAWVLFASARRLSGAAAAADKDQAGLLRDAIDSLVRQNPWLKNFLEVQQTKIINFRTGSELVILSSDAPTSYGLLLDFIIVDELTHFKKRDLWDSLLSAAAKRTHCMLVIIANAGYGQSWQWDTREAVRVDPDWHFSRLDGPVASWISQKLLDEQRRLLPAIAYARLFLNQWTEGVGDALNPASITAALTLDGPAAGPEKGWSYVAGLDIGVKHDASALAILGKHVGYTDAIPRPPRPLPPGPMAALLDCGILERSPASFGLLRGEQDFDYHSVDGTGQLKLVALHIWKPGDGRQVDLDAVEQTIISLNELFKLATVHFDPSQAHPIVQRLRKHGMPCDEFSGTADLKMACAATLGAFNERQISLYENSELLTDLRSLRVVEKNYGVRLESPRGVDGGTQHGDAATALCIAIHAARKYAGFAQSVSGPLVCWP